MNIITLTLNPAFDIHCNITPFRPFSENFGTVNSKDAGGKGLNISRALNANGIDSLAIIAIGNENGAEFSEAVKKDGLNCIFISVDGRIRENYTIHTDGENETRISFDGSFSSSDLLARCEEAIRAAMTPDTALTFTGSIPSCVSKDECKDMLKRLRNEGVKTVIDCRSFSLDDIIECRPYLIKPNKLELCSLLGREISDTSDIISTAQTLHASGVENVMISMGEDGAVLVTKNGTFTIHSPSITPLSTIGAGDSSVAGFLAATSENLDCEVRLKTAVAYGSAACLTEGTRPPRKQDVLELLQKLS